ncbi:hypothetical protein [Vibrio sp. McD22-P3]|uniref:hypothetical protein n=1 Tax=Vibrio sp. McD22-P3 TaxID=2724880 RepID=UPI001F1A217A|nr:hypothetical protein [Vibrio sp. McD22-P3]MCF4173176.1 hypothetical protein [Vibrio sp. McD22-P3]
MGKIIFYMPTPTSDARAWMEYGEMTDEDGNFSDNIMHRKNHRWIQHLATTKDKEAIQIWYQKGVTINELVNISNDDQIYIRGHGFPGKEHITMAKCWGTVVGHRFVVDRLKENGLPKTFTGKIKCYNCNSASWVNVQRSFAQALADYMYGWGYDKCTYYGYRGKLDSYYKNGFDGIHKYIRGGNFTDGVCRASDARVQIKPQDLNPPQCASISGLKKPITE